MEHYLMNCVVCLSSNNLHKFGVYGKWKNKNNSDEADESRCVDNQVQVIFLLRKMLGIPYGVCTKFFQEYGNPSSWIYCCSSCSVLVDKARSVFDDMALLQKKFEKLQKEMKEAIVVSVNSHEKVFLSDLQKGPKEIVRSYITKEYYGLPSVPKIKEEPKDFEDEDGNSEMDFLDWSPVQTSEDEMDDEGDYASSSNFNSHGSENSSNPENGNENGENNGGGYPCDVCGKCFTKKKGLTKHQLIHTGRRLHECDICQKRFTQSGSLQIHYRIHTGERPFVCPYCGKGFPESDRLKCHIRTHTGEKKPLACEICKKRYTNYDTLKAHMKTHEPKKWVLPISSIYKCNVCGEEFSQAALLAEHSKKMHDVKIPLHNCETCKKSFVDLEELNVHKRTDCGQDYYSCSICKTSFTSEKGLNIHLKTHEYNEGDYKCQVCGQKFRTPNLLTFHLKKEHVDQLKTYPCDICGKKFLKTTKLKRHMAVHSDDRPFPCDICGLSFKNAFTLKSHVRIHTGETPHKCLHCGAGFRISSLLSKHIAEHHSQNTANTLPVPDATNVEEVPNEEEEKEWLCYCCGKKYPNQKDLKAHVKIHEGEHANQCDFCGKHFLQASYLKIHLRHHTGERPYKCEFCEKTFKQSVSLILHRRTHTGEKPYPCKMCGKSFAQSSHLYRHQLTHKEFTQPKPS